MNNHRGIGMTSQRTRERLIKRLQDEGIKNNDVLASILKTPRHLFMDEALASRAYEDTALPIGFGQTISQPYIVARMTEAILSAGPVEKVLEIGTGSGYQCAILSHLVTHVYAMERIGALVDQARMRFQKLGLRNISLRRGNGYNGWKSSAPFDAIVVTAAPEEVPQELINQVRTGGKIVIPVGPKGEQTLYLLTKTQAGMDRVVLDYVSFVPLLDDVR